MEEQDWSVGRFGDARILEPRNQALGVGYGWGRTSNIGSPCAEQAPDGSTDMPGIFDQEDARTFQFRRCGRSRFRRGFSFYGTRLRRCFHFCQFTGAVRLHGTDGDRQASKKGFLSTTEALARATVTPCHLDFRTMLATTGAAAYALSDSRSRPMSGDAPAS